MRYGAHVDSGWIFLAVFKNISGDSLDLIVSLSQAGPIFWAVRVRHTCSFRQGVEKKVKSAAADF